MIHSAREILALDRPEKLKLFYGRAAMAAAVEAPKPRPTVLIHANALPPVVSPEPAVALPPPEPQPAFESPSAPAFEVPTWEPRRR